MVDSIFNTFDPIWCWATLGVILIGLELLSGTFYIICFGIAAFLVAGISGAINMGLNAQLITFSIFSVIILSVWHFGYKSKKTDLSIGQSKDETVGKVGKITEVSEDSRMTVSFNMPVMGSRSWIAISEQALEVGSEVRVLGVEGNYLKVEKNN